MPRRLAQQRMTLSDFDWPFHASRAISAVAELVCAVDDRCAVNAERQGTRTGFWRCCSTLTATTGTSVQSLTIANQSWWTSDYHWSRSSDSTKPAVVSRWNFISIWYNRGLSGDSSPHLDLQTNLSPCRFLRRELALKGASTWPFH